MYIHNFIKRLMVLLFTDIQVEFNRSNLNKQLWTSHLLLTCDKSRSENVLVTGNEERNRGKCKLKAHFVFLKLYNSKAGFANKKTKLFF